MDGMTIKNRSVLVTGANRGIGKALVEEARSTCRSRCAPSCPPGAWASTRC